MFGLVKLPECFAKSVSGDHYRDILLNGLPDLLEDVPVTVTECVRFKHEDATEHFSCVVRDLLNNAYHNSRIGRDGPYAHLIWIF
jgi:hypothetical protein